MKQAEPALVFTGHDTGFIPWTLLGFILLSAIAHLLGFYLFQTVYPPAGRMAPPPAQVSLLTGGTPEADALLRWVDSEDPALIVQPRKAPAPGLLDLPYVPSYATVHSRPALLEPASPPLPFPSGASGLDLVEMAKPHTASPAMRPENAPNTLTLSGDLRGELPGSVAALAKLHASQPGDLRPARFLLGVADRGEARYVFLQESSGDRDLDTNARQVLEQLKYPQGNAGLTWGFATFSWGASAYAHAGPTPEARP